MPKYIPSLNPARPTDLDEWNQSRTDFLLNSYKASEARLSALLSQQLTEAKRFRTGELLTQVRSEIMALNKRVEKWAKDGIPHAYKYGFDLTNKTVREYGITPVVNFGNQINTRSIAVLAEQAATDLSTANATVVQNFGRFYRGTQQKVIEDQAITKAISQGLIEGNTLPAITSSLTKQLRANLGEGKFVTAGGRNYKPEYYAEMVARTRTREAAVAGMINTGIQLGMTLVRWDVHGDACPLCRTRMGRVYTIAEGNADFAILESRPPIHPFCKCSLYPLTVESLHYNKEYEMMSELSKSSPQTFDEKEATEWLKQNPSKDIVTVQDYRDFVNSQKPVSVPVTTELVVTPTPEVIVAPPVEAPVVIPPITSAKDAEVVLQKVLKSETKLSLELVHSQDALRRATKILEEASRTVTAVPSLPDVLSKAPIEKIRLLDVQYFKKGRSLSLYNKDSATISVALKNKKKAGLLKVGGWAIDESMEGALRHSIGHHLALTVPRVEYNVFKDFIETKGKQWVAASLSLYAATNTDEAFAEAFTAYTHPAYDEAILPLEIRLLFKRLFGERVQ